MLTIHSLIGQYDLRYVMLHAQLMSLFWQTVFVEVVSAH